MGTIVLEGILFVALLAAGCTLLYWLLITVTPLGTRHRQTQNRLRIERAAELTCPIHGPHTKNQLVRLASGERECPDCYKETLDA